MKVLIFANKMPDLCGAFLHDIDLGTELQKRGHQVVFLTIKVSKEGVNGGEYRGFRYMNYTAANSFLESSQVWICPHAPILPEVRRINSRGFNRPLIATCHYDGNYNMIRNNTGKEWVEMLLFINKTMEPNYRKNITPFPSNIIRTEVIRPIMHREKITITEPFEGDCITLVNANQNKGTHVFLELARRMPDRKFLGVLPYYGELRVPPAPQNVEWIGFDDDIRTILKRTRILLMPSYYESFGRIAVESMINGIPVLYSKPAKKSIYPGGSTEGMQEWIGDAAIACEREEYTEWMEAITRFDDSEFYAEFAEHAKQHIDEMNLFTEASRIAEMVENFAREHPVAIRSTQQQQAQKHQTAFPSAPKEPRGPVGFGFSNGQLRIRR